MNTTDEIINVFDELHGALNTTNRRALADLKIYLRHEAEDFANSATDRQLYKDLVQFVEKQIKRY